MPSYPIGSIVRMTGIPADTLRAWERRYRAVIPKRSPRGRMYSDEQVQRLVLLRKAVDSGHAIGQVVHLEDRHLRELLDSSRALTDIAHSQRNGLASTAYGTVLQAIERYNYAAAERELNRLAAALAAPRDFVHQVALPLMREVGERWHQGQCSIAQEHMLSSLLTSILSTFVRTFTPTEPSARVLFATSQGERHGFPNLAAALITAAGGLGVVHLGTDLPAEEIVTAARGSHVNAVLLSVSGTPTESAAKGWSYISRKVPKTVALWLGGSTQILEAHAATDARWQQVHDFTALELRLAELGARF